MLTDFRTQKIKWDKADNVINNGLSAHEGDQNGRKLALQITDDGEQEDLTGASVSLAWQTRKGDHYGLEAFTETDGEYGLFELVYPTGMLTNVGVLKASIVLIVDGSRLESKEFAITVSQSNVNDEAIESENSFTALTDALVKVDSWNDDLEGFKLGWEDTFSQLEANYAPQLQGVTAQLAQKADEDEIIAARNGEDNLKARLDKENQEVKAQLAQTATNNISRNIVSSESLNVGAKKNREALFTFVDDDGAESVYTRLKPIFDSKGVPCTIGIVSDWVGNDNVGSWNGKALTKEQCLELQRAGWEIAAHSKSHIHMQTVTDPVIARREITQSKEELLKMGLNVKNYIYPYGQRNNVVLDEISRSYKAAAITSNAANDNTNKLPINSHEMVRVGLGSYAGEFDTLEHHKAVIDKAISEGSWLVFMTHVWAQDASKDQLISDVIDYIQSKNKKIVTFDEGLNYFGDKMNINGVMKVSADNKVISDRLITGVNGFEIENFTQAGDIEFLKSKFTKGNIVKTIIPGNRAVGFPNNSAGILTTNFEAIENGYINQTYRLVNTGETFTRTFRQTGGWTVFEALLVKTGHILFDHNFGSVPAHSTSEASIDYPGVNVRDFVIVNPTYPPNAAFLWSARVEADKLLIRVANVTSSAATPGGQPWRFTVIKRNN